VKRARARRPQDEWILRLYTAGVTARSSAALQNLETICEEHLKGRYHFDAVASLEMLLETICEEHLKGRYRIEVVDLLKHPQLARGDQIVAVPTLVRRLPPPMKRIIGDLSDENSVLVGLDLRSRVRRPKGKS